MAARLIMAGTTPDFDAADFRDNIRFAMTMGMPTDAALQGTFRWKRSETFASADNHGNPWDWTDTPSTDSQHDDVTVPIAVEFSTGLRGTVGMGQIDATQVIITILDEDFAQIEGATELEFGDSIYDINFVAPALGLFDATIYQLYATARDES